MFYQKHHDMTISEFTIIRLENAQQSLSLIHHLIDSIYHRENLRQDVLNHRLTQIKDVVNWKFFATVHDKITNICSRLVIMIIWDHLKQMQNCMKQKKRQLRLALNTRKDGKLTTKVEFTSAWSIY